jgi:hypothetical protein
VTVPASGFKHSVPQWTGAAPRKDAGTLANSTAERLSGSAPSGTFRPLGKVGLGAPPSKPPYRLTDKRRAWLEQLRDHGPAKRAKNNIGYDCMQAGWTEWYAKFYDGREMPLSEARKLYESPELWDKLDAHAFRECITDEGRAIIAHSSSVTML